MNALHGNPARACSLCQAPEWRDPSVSRPHLLVVDDDEGTLEFLCLYLERRGFLVATATTAEDALRHLDEHAADLLVLDIMLADADGLHLLSHVKEAHPALPVVMLTGMGYDEELVEEARERGADGYVSKRLVPDQLLLEIHRIMRFGQRVHAGPPAMC